MENYFIFLNCQYFLTLFCLGFLRVNMGLINKVDMVCLSPVGYGV